MTQPIPTEEHKARGTYRADRHGSRAIGNGRCPEKPAGLTGVALATWEETVARLEAMKILDTVDGEFLADYCYAAAELVEGRQERARLQAELATAKKSRAKGAAQVVANLVRELRQV